MRDLRTQWHESLSQDISTQAFFQKYGFVDIAENKMNLFIEGRVIPTNFFGPTKDVPLAHLQLSLALGTDPFDFHILSSLVSRFLSTLVDRPWDGLVFLSGHIKVIVFPLFFSFLLVLLFHISIWARPMAHDLPRFIRSESAFPILLALAVTLMMTIVFQQWAAFVALWGFLAAIYSREKISPIIVACLLTVTLSVWSHSSYLKKTFMGTNLIEALREGRTRLEYSKSDLDQLHPFEKALWAFYNRDIASTRSLLQHLPPSPQTSLLRIVADESTASPESILQRLSELPMAETEPLILFNRSQMSIRAQKLIQSDELRNKLTSDELSHFSQRAARQTHAMLQPEPRSAFQFLADRFQGQIVQWLQDTGLSPLIPSSRWGRLVLFVIPWLFLAFFFFWRRRCSGLCRHTGQPALTRDFDTSSTFQATNNQKSDLSATATRIQIEMEMRAYNHIKTRQTRLWFWIYPQLWKAYEGESFLLSWAKTALLYTPAWLALSPKLQTSFIPFFFEHTGARFNHSYSSPLLGSLFGLLYIIFVARAWRLSST